MQAEPGERLEWGVPADLRGVAVLRCDNSTRRWRFFHETYSFCAGLSIGKPAGWRYRGRVFCQPADGLMLMEPGEVHANTEIMQPASFRVLMVNPDAMQRVSESMDMPARPHLKVAQLQGGAVYRAFLALHHALENGSTRLERQSRLQSALSSMLQACAESPSRAPDADEGRGAAWRARAYIHEHFAEEIRLSDLASAAGSANPFQLLRAFAARYALPPHAYQIRLRISRAQRLLAEGMAPAQVAAQLGFADQSHFTRHFRRVVGITPAHFAGCGFAPVSS